MLRLAKMAMAFALACGLPACAKNHDEIAPAPISPAAYAPATCRELSLMYAKTMRSLVFSELMQDHRYAEDRTRTFGIPTPMATLFEENREAEVARLKGNALAIPAQLERAGCVAREG
jgi:hypothetical protein